MILLIDKEESFINPIAELLCLLTDIKRNEIIVCSNIESAIAALTTQDITAISMEALLPNSDLVGSLYNLNGLNLLKAIRGMFRQRKATNFCNIPITFFTLLSPNDGGIRENADTMNAGFIQKNDPNSMEKLADFFNNNK